jgi:hypothetical protein
VLPNDGFYNMPTQLESTVTVLLIQLLYKYLFFSIILSNFLNYSDFISQNIVPLFSSICNFSHHNIEEAMDIYKSVETFSFVGVVYTKSIKTHKNVTPVHCIF